MGISIQHFIQEKRTIHLIGIGGVSMSALAELLLSHGVPVTGSDRQESEVTIQLEKAGAHITYAHPSGKRKRRGAGYPHCRRAR